MRLKQMWVPVTFPTCIRQPETSVECQLCTHKFIAPVPIQAINHYSP